MMINTTIVYQMDLMKTLHIVVISQSYKLMILVHIVKLIAILTFNAQMTTWVLNQKHHLSPIIFLKIKFVMAHGGIQTVWMIQIVWMAGTKTFRYVATTQIYKLLKMVLIAKLIVIPISNVVILISIFIRILFVMAQFKMAMVIKIMIVLMVGMKHSMFVVKGMICQVIYIMRNNVVKCFYVQVMAWKFL